MIVIVLAAGRGTRMGDIHLPKALLPYKGRAVLDHIFKAWPDGSSFVIAHPEGDSRIKDYVESMYPYNTFVSYVSVPETLISTGPIGTLAWCLQEMAAPAPIGVTVADGVYGKVVVGSPPAKVTLYCEPKPGQHQDYLCVWPPENGFPFTPTEEIFEKTADCPEDSTCWSGVMVAHDVLALRKTLGLVLEQEKPSGAEFSYRDFFLAYGKHAIDLQPLRFVDLGTKEKFEAAQVFEGADYSKPDQVTYVGSTVVKRFRDVDTAQAFVDRHASLVHHGAGWVVPHKVRRLGEFVSYPFVKGSPVEKISDYDFGILLSRLRTHLWGLDLRDSESSSSYFLYAAKTRERVIKYLLEHPEKALPGQPRWTDKLQTAFWSTCDPAKVCPIHGDLTLDNIVLESGVSRFTLIDWRPMVSTSATAFGDIHYDLAKLWVSILIDIHAIKTTGLVDGKLPTHANSVGLQEVLYGFCSKLGIRYTTVVRYGVLLMAAMCGVHKDPLATALYDRSLELSNIVVS